MIKEKHNKSILLTITSLSLIGIDQLSKYLARIHLDESITLIPSIIDLELVFNNGAAFGLLSDDKLFLLILTSAFILGLLVFMAWDIIYKRNNEIRLILFSLILSGAVGNLIDRIYIGQVTDFISLAFINFPVFNIADIVINIGVIGILLDTLLSKD